MQPVKFSGSAADFPVFRKRIRDDLEDGLLSDAQKIEFLPKFVTGDAYDVVARSAGCSVTGKFIEFPVCVIRNIFIGKLSHLTISSPFISINQKMHKNHSSF